MVCNADDRALQSPESCSTAEPLCASLPRRKSAELKRDFSHIERKHTFALKPRHQAKSISIYSVCVQSGQSSRMHLSCWKPAQRLDGGQRVLQGWKTSYKPEAAERWSPYACQLHEETLSAPKQHSTTYGMGLLQVYKNRWFSVEEKSFIIKIWPMEAYTCTKLMWKQPNLGT